MSGTIPVVEAGATSGAVERCSWCGDRLERDDGFRLGEQPGARRAAFCRLEHIVPWAIQGAHWAPGDADEPLDVIAGLETCSHCGAELDDVRVVLVRHRGEHRIPDAFCSVGHAVEWAKAGGRWR
jgi:hypothetical protein